MKKIKWSKYTLFLLVVSLTGILSSCKENKQPVSKSGFMLDTFVTVTLYDSQDESVLNGCLEQCRYYESLFSRTLETSEIWALNHRTDGQETIELSDEMAHMLECSLYYCNLSNGRFDITIEPLSSLWNFKENQGTVPSAQLIEEAVDKVGYKNLVLKGNQLTFLTKDSSLDLGAIAKGYIADRMKDYLLEQGVHSAVINLGGNVLCVGEKPDGSPFKIGVQKPYADRNETVAALDIKDMSVVSSGIYERYFTVDGVNYHHILNAETGYPYETGLISVTIISKESVDGDGLTTACFTLGLEEGLKLIDSIEDAYGIFITDDYDIIYSEGASQLLEGQE